MKLQITALPDTNTLRLVGDLDLYSVEAACEALRTHLTDKAGLELDLGGIETCDTAGMQLLLAAQRSAVASGKSFAIPGTSSAIEKCRELLGLSPDSFKPHTN
jgi:anti-anti-sigma factor